MSDIDLVREAVGDALAPQVLFDNAVSLYRPRVTPGGNDEPESKSKGAQE